MANWDFTVDSSKQSELAGKLDEAANNFDIKVGLLYGQIDSMDNTSWIGDDYNTFHSGAHAYEGALKDLSDGFRMFGEHFRLMSTGTEVLATELISIVNNMTGTNGSSAGGTNYSGGGSTTPNGSDFSGGNTMPSTGGDSGIADPDDSHSPSMSYGAGDEGTGNTGTGSGVWTSYIDALNAGYGEKVVTSADFDRYGGKVDGKSYSSYESYLTEMHNKYINGEGQPTVDTPNTETITYTSGDMVPVGGKTYTFYGAYQKPNGEVVTIYEGENNSLWYQKSDGSFEKVQATHMNGGGQTVKEDATSSSLGTTKSYNVHGAPYNATISLSIDGQKVTSADITTSVTFTGDAVVGVSNPISGANRGTFSNLNSSNAAIETDGGLKTSYLGQIDGTSVNGSTVITATRMDDFNAYVSTQQGGDITLKIPQGQYVQWDSPSGGTGYEFSTGNGAVYLRWDASAAGGQGAYHIVDEYGNVKVNRDFTLDGFNNNGGINGGVWK